MDDAKPALVNQAREDGLGPSGFGRGESDLVAQLRRGQWDNIVTQGPNPTGFCTVDHPAPRLAADIIEALSEREAAKDAEIARLREALQPFADKAELYVVDVSLPHFEGSPNRHIGQIGLTVGDLHDAAAALHSGTFACPICGKRTPHSHTLTKGEVDAG